jgi:drug/metabolite transporter (DMT)-like permease
MPGLEELFMILIIAMYAISATTFLLAKQLLIYSAPLFLVGLRTLIAGLFFLCALVLTTKDLLSSIKKFFLPCASIALYSFLVSNSLKFWALQHLSATDAALISVAEPVFALLFAYYLFSETMSLKKWVGIICCTASGLLLVNNGSMFVQIRAFNLLSVPAYAMIGAIAASAYGALLMRKLIKDNHVSPMLVNGLSMTVAGVCALLTTVCLEAPFCTVTSETMVPFASNLLLLVLISNIIAYSMYGYLLKRYSVLLISCGSFIKPLAIIGYKNIFFYERMPWYTGYSVLLLSIGLAIIYSDEVAFQEVSAENLL